MKHQQKPGRVAGPEAAKYEYLKKMNSPAYRKNVKRSMNMLETYNRLCRDNKMTAGDMRSVTRYFFDDIRNPVGNYRPTEKVTKELILPTKPMKM